MAINPASQYPGQTTPANTDYPYGSARDVSSPGAGDGTPVQQAWVNDWFGFQQRVMQAAGITPSGNPDSATASDVYDGLIGRLLNIQRFTGSGTYTKTPGTKKIRVQIVGGGGGGGGSPATSSTQQATANGGLSGAFADVYMTVPASPVSVTIGTAGSAGTAAPTAGGNGGASSFGSLISCPGGSGGGQGAATAGATFATAANVSNVSPTITTGTIICSLNGCEGGMKRIALGSAANQARGGDGGTSPLGIGGAGGTGRSGLSGTGFGAGGGGCGQVASAAGDAGGAGTTGICIVWEYA